MSKSKFMGAITALSMVGTALSAVPAAAHDWRHHQTSDSRYDRNHNGYDDRYERRQERREDRRDARQQQRRMQYYGGNYGYNGYQGQWRTGQRYPNYNQSRYVVNDYRNYGLPAPRHGYRYYRDNNGDVVMAAIATGVIGLIIGGALIGGNHHRGW